MPITRHEALKEPLRDGVRSQCRRYEVDPTPWFATLFVSFGRAVAVHSLRQDMPPAEPSAAVEIVCERSLELPKARARYVFQRRQPVLQRVQDRDFLNVGEGDAGARIRRHRERPSCGSTRVAFFEAFQQRGRFLCRQRHHSLPGTDLQATLTRCHDVRGQKLGKFRYSISVEVTERPCLQGLSK